MKYIKMFIVYLKYYKNVMATTSKLKPFHSCAYEIYSDVLRNVLIASGWILHWSSV